MSDQNKKSESKASPWSVRALVRRLMRGLRYDHTVLFMLAVVVGVAAAYAAIGFRYVYEFVQLIGFDRDDEQLVMAVADMPAWRIIIVPVIGGLIVAAILRFLVPSGRPESVAEVIEAAALREGRMSIRAGLSTAMATATALGAGASSGREGPVIHLGASVASWVAQRLHLNAALSRTILGCGVASAIAASFNAPIAGVIFALEVVIGHYALHAFAPIVIAGVAGTVVTRIHIGDNPAFTLPSMTIQSFWEFPAFLIVGVAGALAAISLMASLGAGDRLRDRLSRRVPEWLLPPLSGLMIGIIALAFPQILGVGYEATDAALNERLGLWLLILLIPVKILATTISISLRFGNGVFTPSLFLGAMTGGAVGLLASQVFPDLSSGYGLYAVVGMGAVASAVLGAPISTMLIIFELTGDYGVTIAVMVASAIASLITQVFYHRSLFLLQLERRGLFLEGGKATHLLRANKVRSILDQDFVTISEDSDILRVRQLLLDQNGEKLLVTDQGGKLTGVITLADLPADAFEEGADETVTAGSICRRNPTVVIADDPLRTALMVMDQTGEECIPVLANADDRVIIGLVHYRDVSQAYTRALLEAQGQDQSQS